ncbi:MAG: Holliday junction branch migration protein RuvA [Erysipelotrichaceae bacterium]
MIAYIKGIITNVELDRIIVENQGIGYEIYFSRPERVSINDEVKIYTYQKVAEDELSLFGFLDKRNLDFFIKLLSVKGIGAKSANNIIANSNLDTLVAAINADDLNYLKTINGIGNKSAAQIILDLKGKLAISSNEIKVPVFESLKESLKYLGYKSSQINSIIMQLSEYEFESEEVVLKKALQLLASKRG